MSRNILSKLLISSLFLSIPVLAQPPGTAGTGAYPAVQLTEPGLPNQVIYRPANLDALGNLKLGVYAFGNGGCSDDAASSRPHLLEVASHGYLAIAPGGIYSGPGATERSADAIANAALDPAERAPATRAEQLVEAIDWALAVNADPDSPYYGRVDTDAIALSGFSCGGLQALVSASDPRVGTTVIMNSGVINGEVTRMAGMEATKAVLEDLHFPTLYVLGGPTDIAYENGMDDYRRISHVPVAVANIDKGHGGTYNEPNGGEAARVVVGWLEWQLRDDATASSLFLGADCGLCADPVWTFEKKGLDESFTITVQEPENGTLTFEPAIPADGRLPSGSTLRVTATPRRGYSVDTVYGAVPGVFGVAYLESMDEQLELTVDQDIRVSALFLPASEFDGFTVRQDVVYAQPGVKPLKYDVWTPDRAENLPIVVIIHGGGWGANTEDIMRGMAREMVRTGRYVVASIDYRWSGYLDGDATPNTMADIIGDVFGAIAHIQEHASEYGGDATRIAVTGDSAGGHLSAAAATMSEMIGDGGFGRQAGVFEFMPSYIPSGKSLSQVRDEITAAIRAAAPSYGVFSAQSYDGGPALEHYSPDPLADEAWGAAIAPINHVPAYETRSIPHYLTRGTRDVLISNTMVADYANALSAQHQRVRYDEVPNANHAFFDWKPDQRTRDVFAEYGVPYVGEMVRFFDSVF